MRLGLPLILLTLTPNTHPLPTSTSTSLHLHLPPLAQNMTTPPRHSTTFAIPGTALTLHLTLDPTTPLPPPSIRACLHSCTALIASSPDEYPKEGTLEVTWRCQPQPGSHEGAGQGQQEQQQQQQQQARFAISPGVFVQHLTWGDVESTLRGLEAYFEQSGGWVETWFEVVGEGRGVLGDGLVRRGE